MISATQHPEVVSKYLAEELEAGRVIKAGMLKDSGIFHYSPLGSSQSGAGQGNGD